MVPRDAGAVRAGEAVGQVHPCALEGARCEDLVEIYASVYADVRQTSSDFISRGGHRCCRDRVVAPLIREPSPLVEGIRKAAPLAAMWSKPGESGPERGSDSEVPGALGRGCAGPWGCLRGEGSWGSAAMRPGGGAMRRSCRDLRIRVRRSGATAVRSLYHTEGVDLARAGL